MHVSHFFNKGTVIVGKKGTKSNNRNVIEDSGNHYNIIRYEVVAVL